MRLRIQYTLDGDREKKVNIKNVWLSLSKSCIIIYKIRVEEIKESFVTCKEQENLSCFIREVKSLICWDSDYVGDLGDRKSTSGYVFMMG